MLVSQILRTKGDTVFTVKPSDTVGEVAELLHTRRVGALVVLDAERVAGIVSERDVVRAVATGGAGALARPVSDFMTANVLFAEPGETVDNSLSRMTDRRIRHLPVCQTERLVGIVSIGDLVKWKISEVEAEADGLKAYIAAS
ncbi:CBS domain-containing protein [Phenylobacterium sp.]|uniref:CBS domain-containing protein n=1 Tax=Phenylobacterium sp. TaxID=1871053 RepID=UPI00301D2BF6